VDQFLRTRLNGLKEKSFAELSQLVPYQGERSIDGGKSYTVSVWRDSLGEGQIRIVVQVYRYFFLGIGHMTADGFRIDRPGPFANCRNKSFTRSPKRIAIGEKMAAVAVATVGTPEPAADPRAAALRLTWQSQLSRLRGPMRFQLASTCASNRAIMLVSTTTSTVASNSRMSRSDASFSATPRGLP
jgi:hypothetical protein